MSFIQRFLLGNRIDDDLQVGLFLKNDGTVWLRNPDGSETQVGGGGGSGLPSWWTVDESAMTVTVAFPDDPDGDYIGLTIEAPDDFDGFSGVHVESSNLVTAADLSFDGLKFAGQAYSAQYLLTGAAIQQSADSDAITLLISHGNDSDRTQDLAQIYKANGAAMLWGVNKSGLEYKQNNSFTEPDDGDVAPNQILEWYDSTENAIAARFKAQDSAGNAFAGKVATMLPDGSAFQGVALPLLAASPTVAQISTVLAGLGLTRQT